MPPRSRAGCSSASACKAPRGAAAGHRAHHGALVGAAAQPGLLADWAVASGPAGRLSHPPRAEEHLLPLHVVAGEGRFTVRLEGIPEADMDKFEQRSWPSTRSAWRAGRCTTGACRR
ncbi:hypothetical protein G7045_13880 [Acidovorax sp. HDW3]|uniref:hypothetical protein n=1 Tax=Acidovorax sp. HDW3 TaxID=2714923 RepID=UPI00140A209D|nr:hypothetical protein [Acidovorax sp. HDW3]QIL42762.1 hypothetical protein G7045_13880 [Acidovorax sp. HDW3]